MRIARLLLVTCLVLAGPAWAEGAPPPSASMSVAKASPEAARKLPQVHRRLQHDQIQVKRLQRDVAKQESTSRRAGERLQQQDRAIAELQRQLRQFQANHAGEGQH
jgi:septal ring factor EnvC (AmiA/AmiB activator)